MMGITFSSKSSLLIFFLLLILCFSNASNSSITSQYTSIDQSNLIPFNNLFLKYEVNGKKNNLPFFASLNVSYNKLEYNSVNFYDYNFSIAFQSLLIQGTEYATYYENSSTRNILLNNINGTYISFIIQDVLPFNSSTNALNWDPFWIIPADINNTYPIYSFFLNVTDRTTIGPSDVSALTYTTPAVVIKGNQIFNNTDNYVTNEVGLIYDNYTGFLLYGDVNTTISTQNITNSYTARFSLISTNGFSVFPPYPSQQSINYILQKPNYFLLALIILFPILITISRLLRLKEISGGLK